MRNFIKNKYLKIKTFYLQNTDNENTIKCIVLVISLMLLMLGLTLLPALVSLAIICALFLFNFCYYIWNLPDKWFK